jgi:hypothetical protein
LWGHGFRLRLVEGPSGPFEEPADREVMARRYLCRLCNAVLVVVPRGIVSFRRYTANAIAQALALFATGATVAEVRRRTSTTSTPAGFGPATRWSSLRRWVAEAARGVLFSEAQVRHPDGAAPREIASRVAHTLAAHALPSQREAPLPAAAFHGAVAVR